MEGSSWTDYWICLPSWCLHGQPPCWCVFDMLEHWVHNAVFNMMPTGGEGYGTLCLEGMPCLGMVRKLLNISSWGNMDIWTSILSLCYYLTFSIWKHLLFMELPMKRSLQRFACRQKAAIIGHFRWSFLKEAECAQKCSSLKTNDAWSLNCFIKFGFMTTQVLC